MVSGTRPRIRKLEQQKRNVWSMCIPFYPIRQAPLPHREKQPWLSLPGRRLSYSSHAVPLLTEERLAKEAETQHTNSHHDVKHEESCEGPGSMSKLFVPRSC